MRILRIRIPNTAFYILCLYDVVKLTTVCSGIWRECGSKYGSGYGSRLCLRTESAFIFNANTDTGVQIQQSVIHAHQCGPYPEHCVCNVIAWKRGSDYRFKHVMRESARKWWETAALIKSTVFAFNCFLLYIFWRARVCLPLLCLSCPIIIFEECLVSNPES